MEKFTFFIAVIRRFRNGILLILSWMDWSLTVPSNI